MPSRVQSDSIRRSIWQDSSLMYNATCAHFLSINTGYQNDRFDKFE